MFETSLQLAVTKVGLIFLPTLHCTALHCTALHCTALQWGEETCQKLDLAYHQCWQRLQGNFQL
jgi:hypothetical protein